MPPATARIDRTSPVICSRSHDNIGHSAIFTDACSTVVSRASVLICSRAAASAGNFAPTDTRRLRTKPPTASLGNQSRAGSGTKPAGTRANTQASGTSVARTAASVDHSFPNVARKESTAILGPSKSQAARSDLSVRSTSDDSASSSKLRSGVSAAR